MKAIPLFGPQAKGRVVLIDDEDYGQVSPYRWLLWEREAPGCRANGPYARCNMTRDGREIRPSMHNLITGWPLVDHIDHDGLNNRRSNLRPATTAQNIHNMRPYIGHSSQYKGVTWHRRIGKWQAAIKLNGRCVYLGVFAAEEDAALAYNAAALAAWGEYAYLNEVSA